MRIRFRQSGGFAGLVRGCEVDASNLPADARAALDALLARGVPSAAAGGADRLQYELAVTRDDGTKASFEFGESVVTDAIRPLVSWLSGRSRPVAP